MSVLFARQILLTLAVPGMVAIIVVVLMRVHFYYQRIQVIPDLRIPDQPPLESALEVDEDDSEFESTPKSLASSWDRLGPTTPVLTPDSRASSISPLSMPTPSLHRSTGDLFQRG